MDTICKNLVVVGEKKSGKTSLLRAFTGKTFEEEYVKTRFDNFQTNLVVNDQNIQLRLRDTSGRHEMYRVRRMAYPGAHVILLCFSTVDPQSLEEIIAKWYGEVNHHCRDTPKILIGCKEDLRMEEEIIKQLAQLREPTHPVTYSEGSSIATQLHLYGYFECSAKTGYGVQEVLQAAADAPIKVQNADRRSKHSCNVL